MDDISIITTKVTNNTMGTKDKFSKNIMIPKFNRPIPIASIITSTHIMNFFIANTTIPFNTVLFSINY